MGPGFEAGEDVDAVVETDRGHELGRVLYEGTASEYDGEPGERRGYTHERVLRAPADGIWTPAVAIGDSVTVGDVVGTVDDRPVETEIDGLVRGLIHGARRQRGHKARRRRPPRRVRRPSEDLRQGAVPRRWRAGGDASVAVEGSY